MAWLTLDERRYQDAEAERRKREFVQTGQVRTGTVFDELEAKTGGNITAEAFDAFLASKA